MDLGKRNENNAEFQKKVFEIQKELNLQKGEHEANIKELNSKI